MLTRWPSSKPASSAGFLGGIFAGEQTKALWAYKQQVLTAMKSSPGFTGTDANGHKWVNGKQVALGKEQPSAPAAPKIDPAKFPEQPEFVSKNEQQVAGNKKAVAELHALAVKGDLPGLQSHKGTPSPKVQAYQQALIHDLDQQLHPPPPPKQYPGQLDGINKVYSGAGDPAAVHAKKIGQFLITEEPGVPNVQFVGIDLPTKGYLLKDSKLQAEHDAAFKAMQWKPAVELIVSKYLLLVMGLD